MQIVGADRDEVIPPLITEAGAMEAFQRVPVSQWRGAPIAVEDAVAVEVPCAFVVNGRPFAVMLASPSDLEDLARGFCLTESIVGHAGEFQGVEIVAETRGYSIYVSVPRARAEAVAHRERGVAGRTGCGLCGERMLEDAIRAAPPVTGGGPFRIAALQASVAAIEAAQKLNRLTGAVHAAAWIDGAGAVRTIREDVGRHNALDKLIGALLRMNVDPSSGFVFVTSRASYEMVHKAAILGAPMLVAVSAPTALAVEMAQAANITLVGFARPGRHSVYSCAQRLID